jgi:anti-sigma factor RsiW
VNDHLEEELLNRYFDGELRPARAATVAQHLERCSECSARHQSLASLRGMIDMAAEESGRNVDFEALYGRIERGIREQARPGWRERARVYWRDLSEQRPGQVWVPATGLLAAAAMLLVWIGAPSQSPADPQARPRTRSVPVAPSLGAPAPEPPTALAAGNSEIVQVDFGGNAGTVFEIALADGVSTPVVWINDDVQQ